MTDHDHSPIGATNVMVRDFGREIEYTCACGATVRTRDNAVIAAVLG